MSKLSFYGVMHILALLCLGLHVRVSGIEVGFAGRAFLCPILLEQTYSFSIWL